MLSACRAYALLQGRGYVVPEDIKTLAAPVFAHRLVLSGDVTALGADNIIANILFATQLRRKTGTKKIAGGHNMEIILIIAGAALLYYLQNLIYKKYWDRGLSVSLRFSDATCTEGGKNSLIEVITNRNWLPLPVLRVRFKSGKYLRFAGSENVSVSDGSYKNDIFPLCFTSALRAQFPL